MLGPGKDIGCLAEALEMTARSSAAVLHALTLRMRSRNFKDMMNVKGFRAVQ